MVLRSLKYLDSQRAQEAVENSFGLGGNRIRVRTVRRWLHTMGFDYNAI
jgi:hypothetical protein